MAEQTPELITGLPYGENQEANDIAQAQPLAAAEQMPPTPSLTPPPSTLVGLEQGSKRPEEDELTEYTGPAERIFDDERELSLAERRPDVAQAFALFEQDPSPELLSYIGRLLS